MKTVIGRLYLRNLISQKGKETLEAIEKLSLMDDNLMTLVFDRNTEATELLLKLFLAGMT